MIISLIFLFYMVLQSLVLLAHDPNAKTGDMKPLFEAIIKYIPAPTPRRIIYRF